MDVNELAAMLARCQSLEERAALVYRAFAAVGAAKPELCALWTTLAREEDEHAKTLAMAQLRLAPGEGVRTHVEGWSEAMEEIEERLTVAGQQANGASTDRQLEAALQLEMTELESLRLALLAASDHGDPAPNDEAHAEHLAQAATRLSTDPQVRLLAALLLARARLTR
jgi:rubrerythrin